MHFLFVGPQRTASSWLHHVLSHHPDLCLPKRVKETMYFDERYAEMSADDYAAHFSHCAVVRLRGEVGPTYFDSVLAMERIASAHPSCKIVIGVRNPIERSHSSYRHHLTKGRVNETFLEAVQSNPRICDAGRYAVHAPKWERKFGAAKVHYFVQSDLEHSAQRVVDRLLDFLDVAPMPIEQFAQKRVGKNDAPRFKLLATLAARGATWLRRKDLHGVAELGKRLGVKQVFRGGHDARRHMSAADFEYLMSVHAEDIEFLEERLQRDLSTWRDFRTYGVSGHQASAAVQP